MGRLSALVENTTTQDFEKLHEEISFDEYLDKCYANPKLVRNSFQRIYDMIVSEGTNELERYRKKVVTYKFFENHPQIKIFGIEEQLEALVSHFKGAAGGFGPEKRILLLCGPVGSSKSTILRLIKRGLEAYSRIDDGALYTFKWVNLPAGAEGIYTSDNCCCPMNEEPLKLIPIEIRKKILTDLNKILRDKASDKEKSTVYNLHVDGELDPKCKFFYEKLLEQYKGDWSKVIANHIVVKRMHYSETNRVGIASFQPKDEKNQDSTELTGDINFALLPTFGSDSDPRCVVGETYVSTNKGYVQIGNMIPSYLKEDEFGDALSENLSITSIDGVEKIDSYYYGGEKQVMRLTTKLGYTITASQNHKLFVMNENGKQVWKKMSNISSTDYVALFRGSSVFSENNHTFESYEPEYYGNERNKPTFPQKTSSKLGYLFGLWIGDGHYYVNEEKHQYSFGWTQLEPERRQKFAEIFSELFGVEINAKISKDHSPYLEIGSKNLYKWLTQIAGLTGKSVTKLIPSCILQSTKEVILSCLQGLWETDGTISNRKEKHNHSNVASFVSCSKILCSQIQTLLLGFGVVSSLRKSAENTYIVSVYGKNVNILCELIPSLKERFTQGELTDHKSSPNVDVIPNIKPLMKTVYKFSKNKDDLKARFSGNIHDKKKLNVSYDTLKDFVETVECGEAAVEEYNALKSICESNYVWLPVQDCVLDGFQKVFDFTVDNTHAYWANGFVSHNCFSFDGEFQVANRGIIEFIEMLKLEVAFLYDLLGASQEQSVKPKKFAQISIDEAIVGHTNIPEYEKLKNNQYMEALKDRTVKIEIPYLLEWQNELKVLEQDYNSEKIAQHIAPHTLEIAALFAVLTRLDEDKDSKISLVEKAELYDGKMLPGWTIDRVKELKEKNPQEGISGLSARYIQDKISSTLSSRHDYINPFMVLNALKSGLESHSLITNKDIVRKYQNCITLTTKKLDDILKHEVQKALVGDEEAIVRLCSNYIDNLMAYINKSKITNKITGREESPDEKLMRSIESKIDVPEATCDDFRRMIAAFIGDLAIKQKIFRWDSNALLKKALEAKLFEDTKDHIKISAFSSGASTVDADVQKKIDAVKQRLIEKYGYNEQSATDVLEYVSSIFARGDLADEE